MPKIIKNKKFNREETLSLCLFVEKCLEFMESAARMERSYDHIRLRYLNGHLRNVVKYGGVLKICNEDNKEEKKDEVNEV